MPKLNLKFPDPTKKNYVFKTLKQDDSSHYIVELKFLSESDDLSGLIGSISHDDLNSLDDLDSLFDLKKAKYANALDTEWFFWPQSP